MTTADNPVPHQTARPQSRYRRRPAEVDAIQWTGNNAADLTAFAGTRFMETDPEDRTDNPDATAALLESEHDAWFDLEPGDWVVRRHGVFEALGDEEFADLYEPADGTLRQRIADAILARIKQATVQPGRLMPGGTTEHLFAANEYDLADVVLPLLTTAPAPALADDEQPPVPRAQPTEYEVCCLTEDDINSLAFTLTVRYRGAGRWAVQRGEHSCLGADGKWAQGIKEYDRGKTWLDQHRFDLDTALRLAKAAARDVTVNGYTVADALAMYERDTAGGEQA